MPETPRFVPLGQMPEGGGSPPSTGGAAARFVPISGAGASGGGGTLNLPGLFQQFQTLGQGGGMGSGIAKGAGMLGSALGKVDTAGGLLGGLTGGGNPIPAGLGQGLGIAGGALGLGSNIYGLSQGDYSQIPGTISGGLGLAGGIGAALGSSAAGGLSGAGAAALAGGGAAGAAAAAGPLATGLSTLGAVGGTLALPLAGVGIGLSNMMQKNAQKAKQQTIESGDIRRGLAEAVPNVQKAVYTAQNLDRVNSLPPEQQIAALQQAREALQKGVEDLSVDFSRFISTGGQGGKASLVGKVPTGDAERIAAEAWPDVVAGLLRVQDALAQRGVALPATEVGPLTNRSPAAMLNFAKSFAGAPANYRPYDALTPDALAQVGPGNLEQFFVSQLGQQNPQFGQSAMGQRLAGLPRITAPAGANSILQAIMPQYLADQQRILDAERQGIFNPQLSAADQAIAASYTPTEFSSPPPSTASNPRNVGNFPALAPYTQGGMGRLLTDLLGPRASELYQQGVPLQSIPGMIQQQDEAARFAAGGNL